MIGRRVILSETQIYLRNCACEDATGSNNFLPIAAPSCNTRASTRASSGSGAVANTSVTWMARAACNPNVAWTRRWRVGGPRDNALRGGLKGVGVKRQHFSNQEEFSDVKCSGWTAKERAQVTELVCGRRGWGGAGAANTPWYSGCARRLSGRGAACGTRSSYGQLRRRRRRGSSSWQEAEACLFACHRHISHATRAVPSCLKGTKPKQLIPC